MSAPAPLLPARCEFANDGIPYSSSYDDLYHAVAGGLDQARHVFLGGNQLPQRWQGRTHFTILETGFGTGLSFLATWQAWRNDPQRCRRLHFVSTELHPFTRADLQRLQAAWPELAALAAELQAAWPPLVAGFHRLLLDAGRVSLTLLFGDARACLDELQASADALYLDGFAPQKNPALWSPELLATLTRHAAPDATLASWCVAGHVRQALIAEGWQMKKAAGFAHKRHMLRGQRTQTAAPSLPQEQRAIVIGGGIAGCCAAEALVRRGWQISLIEQQAAPQSVGPNPVGILHPMLARDDNAAARLTRAAYLYALRLLQQLDGAGCPSGWQGGGLLQLADAATTHDPYAALGLPTDYVRWVEREEASALAGLPVPHAGWWFAQGATVNPIHLRLALLQAAAPGLQCHWETAVTRLASHDGHWHAFNADGETIASAPHVVLANAAAAATLVPDLALTLRSIRGQISILPATPLQGLQSALCGEGYLTPPREGTACLGASFVEHDTNRDVRISEHEANLQRLAQLLPGLAHDYAAAQLQGMVGLRTASHDRLPLIGTLPQAQFRVTCTLNSLPRQAGLHTVLGLGSRGLIWAPLGAELLAARLNGEPLPIERNLLRAIDPARFHLRQLRRQS